MKIIKLKKDASGYFTPHKTPCVFYPKIGVSSVACQECKYNELTDFWAEIVKCNHP